MARSPDSLPDWFVGGAGKRRLMYAVIKAGSKRTWTEKELAEAAELHEKNSLRRHVAVLLQARLLRGGPGAYRLNARSPLVGPLDSFLTFLEDRVPRQPLPPSRGGGGKGSS